MSKPKVFNGPNSTSFCLFSFFSHDKQSTNLTKNDKSVDGLLGTRTRGSRMVDVDESTELTQRYTYVIGYRSLLSLGPL